MCSQSAFPAVRALAWAALLSAALHALAGAGTLLLLAPGSLAEPDPALRAAYVDARTEAWGAGWLLWGAAAASLLLVYAALAPPGPPGLAGMALGAAGLAVDLHTDAAFVFTLPAVGGEARALLERGLFVQSGLVANGLYTLAGALLLPAAVRAGRLPRGLALAAVPVGVAGVALCVATAADARVAVVASAGLLVAGVTAWLAALGGWAWRAS